MTLPELCIRRPVFATVLSLAIMLIGLISYSRLAIREYPKIDEPVVSVETTYRGASAEVIESQVTKPLEDSLSGIEGVELLTSASRSEVSSITVRFKLTRDPDAAAAEVRDKVARVRGRLPDAVDEPVISKQEADSQPIVYIAFNSDRHSQLELSDYAYRYLRPRLTVLPGVADVLIFGERKPAMRIWIDAQRLAAYRLTVQDVEDALRRSNVEIPAGRIESQAREFAVVADTDLRTPTQFGDMIVKESGGTFVRLKDVAKVEIGPASERSINRLNGRPAVTLAMLKQATANPLDLSDAARKEVAELGKMLPAGMELVVSYDSSMFIKESIKSVFQTIGEAVLLVVLVIFIFLRSLRATIVPIVTIPVSLIGAFALMYAFGFTINVLTLLAIVLAIGLVVDDAIVVLENIFRNMEHGMPRREAAFKGAKEIGFAVVAMTLTLAAVYAPLAFATGRTGRLFIEFALALAGAVLVSGFVALTLSPMMCSQILKYSPKHGALYNVFERFFEGMTALYRRAVTATLRHRGLVLLIGLAIGGSSYFLFKTIKSELAPVEDRGVIFSFFSAPEGSTVQYTSANAQKIEEVLSKVPEAASYFAVAGRPTVSDGIAIARLKPWGERERKQQDITKALFPEFQKIPGLLAFPVNPPQFGARSDKPVKYVLLSQAPYQELQRMGERLQAEIAKNPGFVAVDTDLRLNKPEVRVTVNRDKLADTGVAVDTVGRTLETMLGGRLVTRFKQDGEQYDVIVQITENERSTPDRISALYVRGKNSEMIPLANLVTVRETVSPKSLNHFNRLRSIEINANLAPDYSLGEAINFLNTKAREVLPPTVQTDLAGQSREFRDSSSSIFLVFMLALGFIYLVLSAQFESFVDPLIIMLTVPLSITGALGALLLSGGSLNVYSQIGLITLVGLITKHGILIVEFSNQLQEHGKPKHEAVIESAVMRLRPILMTTGAMVLGAIPLALASGAGAESRVQIGWVIVGGLLVGTFFTLFVVPCAYSLFARTHHHADEPGAPLQAADGAAAFPAGHHPASHGAE